VAAIPQTELELKTPPKKTKITVDGKCVAALWRNLRFVCKILKGRWTSEGG